SIRQVQEAGREFGAGAGVFVLEEHVSLFPAHRSHIRDPLGKRLFRVILAARPDVSPIGCGNKLRPWKVLGVGDAERTMACAKAVEYFLIEPAFVPEFEGRLPLTRDKLEERSQPRNVFFE